MERWKSFFLAADAINQLFHSYSEALPPDHLLASNPAGLKRSFHSHPTPEPSPVGLSSLLKGDTALSTPLVPTAAPRNKTNEVIHCVFFLFLKERCVHSLLKVVAQRAPEMESQCKTS